MEAVASSQAQLFSRQPIAVVQVFHEMEWKWNDSTAGCCCLPWTPNVECRRNAADKQTGGRNHWKLFATPARHHPSLYFV